MAKSAVSPEGLSFRLRLRLKALSVNWLGLPGVAKLTTMACDRLMSVLVAEDVPPVGIRKMALLLGVSGAIRGVLTIELKSKSARTSAPANEPRARAASN